MGARAATGWRRLLPGSRPGDDIDPAPVEEHVVEPEPLIRERELADLVGTVNAVTLRPRATHLSDLVAEMVVEEQVVRLIWLGRRSIAGIEPGRSLTAHGRICVEHGVPTIFNPAYELGTRDV